MSRPGRFMLVSVLAVACLSLIGVTACGVLGPAKSTSATQPLTGSNTPGAEPMAGTCESTCDAAYQSCVLLAAGDADLIGVCSQQHAACLAACPAGAPTITVIGVDKPDPSKPGSQVTVHVAVVGADHPSGTITVTGADVNCSFTLNAGAIGHGTVVFNNPGTYTLTASYSGDETHSGSSSTETHVVSN